MSRLSKPLDSWPSANAIMFPVIYWFTHNTSPCNEGISEFKTLIFILGRTFSTPYAFNICFTKAFRDFVIVKNAKIGNLTKPELMTFKSTSKRSMSLYTFPTMIILSLFSFRADAYIYSPRVMFNPLNTAWFKRIVADRNIKLHRFWSRL